MALGGSGTARPDQRRTGLSQPGSGPAPSNTFINPVIIVTPGKGVFVYDPTPAAGNLVASISADGGTDPYGNKYLAGIANYAEFSGTFYAVNIAQGNVQFFHAASESAGWTLDAYMSDLWQIGSQPGTAFTEPVGLVNMSSAPTAVLTVGQLYVDTAGDLYYLSPGGTSTKLASG